MRCGADHMIPVAYEEVNLATCPVMAVEEFVSIGSTLGWNMESGYFFTVISWTSDGKSIRGSSPISAPSMTKSLQAYAREAGERTHFTMHSFRSGGVIVQALDGSDLSTIMTRAFWKRPQTAWRYMRLMEVVAPGSQAMP